MTILQWAQGYTSRGWSVFPLNPDRTPAIPWKSYQTRLATDKELSAWFKKKYSSIGIVTGKISDLTVVDLDSKEAIAFSLTWGAPFGPRVITGKGQHLYFHYAPGTRNWQKKPELPGIDLRSEGGYVVAPPSKHPDYDRLYTWEDAKFPLTLVPEIILAAQSRPVSELYKGSKKDERNGNLTRVVGKLAWADVPDKDIREQAHRVNERNSPPLPPAEVNTIVDSILAAHKRSHPTIEIKYTTASSLKSESYEWIWKPFIPIEEVTVFAGPGGIGKGWIMLDIAMSLSVGKFGPIGTSMFFSAEDNPQKVIRPRLNMIHKINPGNLDRIIVCESRFQLNEAGFQRLSDGLAEYGPKMVVIDPVKNWFDSKLKMSDSVAVGQWMDKLQELAVFYKCSIVMIHHYNKALGDQATHKVSGSTAFVDSARSTLQILHSQDGNNMAFAQTKLNLDRKGKNQGFQLDDGVKWLKDTPLEQSSLIAKEYRDTDKSKLTNAEDFTIEQLSSGPLSSTELNSRGRTAGHSETTLGRARGGLQKQEIIEFVEIRGTDGMFQGNMWKLKEGEI